MRKTALFVLAAAIAAPLAAGDWWPDWTPRYMQLMVGEHRTARVLAKWSGLVDYGNGIHWSFASDNTYVALGSVDVEDARAHDVDIVAVAPGKAWIAGVGQRWVEIDVICGAPEPPVRAAAPVIRARAGEMLTLRALSDIAARSRFTWYLGRDGDTSHPLAATGTEIFFVPRTAGTQYLWVNATTPCTASTAEFRIDVSARPRAAGR